MTAMMVQIAPAEVGHKTKIQLPATNRVPTRDENERPLPRWRTAALCKTVGLQRVVYGRTIRFAEWLLANPPRTFTLR